MHGTYHLQPGSGNRAIDPGTSKPDGASRACITPHVKVIIVSAPYQNGFGLLHAPNKGDIVYAALQPVDRILRHTYFL